MIQHIPTSYHGRQFRSKLEATWAYTFDYLGILWWYEPQGFELNGLRYLCDYFWPKYAAWVEIKPFALRPKEIAKCVSLANETGYRVIALVGEPEEHMN